MRQSQVAWVYYRIARHGLAPSVIEVRRNWSVIDVLEAHRGLDVEADIEAFAAREAEREAKKRRKR